MSEKTNSPIHLRPRFTIDLQLNKEQVLTKFKKVLKDTDSRFPSRFVDGHIIIDVPKKEEHFWSPQLHLEVVDVPENTTILKGLFGPKPQVWTLFMFIHTSVGIAFLVFGVMLYAKWRLDESIILPLMMTIFLPLFWVLLYFLGRIGKSTGHGQMNDLHDLMTNILNN